MTLFIACLLIYGFKMSGAWYVVATVLYLLRIAVGLLMLAAASK